MRSWTVGTGGRGAAPWVLAAVLLVGINLRGPIAAVGPVLEEVTDEVGLSTTTAGLLTSLPVLCFALAAPLAAWLGGRLGAGRAVALGLVVIALGLAGRVVGGAGTLLAGTVVVGIGMTVGNVLVPVVIKREFADPGRVTGLYTATLAGGAALTAALVAPASTLGGWRPGLAVWAVLPVAALALWWSAVGRRDNAALPATGQRVRQAARARPVWVQPMAWGVALTLGFQSALYYSLTTWLPTMLRDDVGLARQAAGTAMSVFQLLAIPATLLVPALCRLRPDQAWLGLVVGAGWLGTAAGLLLAPQWWLLWCVLGALTQGAGISLAFTLVVLRAADSQTVRTLGAMSQLVGYGLGALGPIALGAVNAATGSWAVPLGVLCGVAALMGLSAAAAGRDRVIT